MDRGVRGALLGLGVEQAIGHPSPLISFLLTLGLETLVIFGFVHWRHKPLQSLVLSGVFINSLTQPLLWIGLMIFYTAYFWAVLIGEVSVFLVEAFILKRIPTNCLSWRESFLLSLAMNGLSFGIGLALPI